MLTEAQINGAWRKMAEAEVRALYFGELASKCMQLKQWIVAVSFVLSSGAALTALGEWTPMWFPGLLSLAITVLMGYSIGFKLDDRASEMARLHSSWDHLADDYEHLWNRWYEPDAERVLVELQRRARELSEAGTKAPYKSDRVEYWGSHVYSSYPNLLDASKKTVTEET